MATPRRRALQTPNATSPGPTLDSITVAGDGSSSPETPTSDDLPDATTRSICICICICIFSTPKPYAWPHSSPVRRRDK
ncbi:hypothetical protein COL922a_013762 [Colletotrichum nupharicola]|nr:hypothetical protein COL922a_013762 [Colletotrichum nupharicola]